LKLPDFYPWRWGMDN